MSGTSFAPVRFGVMGVAKIADQKVIPPLTTSPLLTLEAIASRDLDRARTAAAKHGIARAHGSYEALLADPAIEAVYIPLPNHLHVDWALKAIAAGKHVLCEKPIALTAADVAKLRDAAKARGVTVMEGFMVLSHPLWQSVRAMIAEGRIGEVHALHMSFASPNYDPANIRNSAAAQGGSLTDKGCYASLLASYLFGGAPVRVIGAMDVDAAFGVDRLTTALLDFSHAQASFNCSSQLAAYQHLVVMGTKGRIEVEIPVNLPDDAPTRLTLVAGSTLPEQTSQTVSFAPLNQYRLMFEQFCRAVRLGEAPSVSLDLSERNAAIIDALFRSTKSHAWETV